MKKHKALLLLLVFLMSRLLSFSQPHRYEQRHRYPSRAGLSVFASVPFGAVALSFGNRYYHYYHGLFYQPVPGGYGLVSPPVGLIVPLLPPGSVSIFVGPALYYRYQNVFYIPIDSKRYQVAEPPADVAENKQTPNEIGYEKLVIDGKIYYKRGDKYYKAQLKGDGEIIYEEVGKLGK